MHKPNRTYGPGWEQDCSLTKDIYQSSNTRTSDMTVFEMGALKRGLAKNEVFRLVSL
jgi:hypothetical protein